MAYFILINYIIIVKKHLKPKDMIDKLQISTSYTYFYFKLQHSYTELLENLQSNFCYAH